MSVNKVILIGNLGRDPEIRYTQGGTAVASLNIATTRKWRNKQSNELQEETEWHRVAVFGQTAEHCNNYLAKGRQVYVEGRLQTRDYTDKDGNKRYSTEVVADVVQFLGGKGEGGGGGERGGERRQAPKPSRRDEPDAYDPGDYSPVGDNDDDGIPF